MSHSFVAERMEGGGGGGNILKGGGGSCHTFPGLKIHGLVPFAKNNLRIS